MDAHIVDHLTKLSFKQGIPQAHVEYIKSIKDYGHEPKVIYDIGSCVLYWTNMAKKFWPQSEYILFDAFNEAEFLYKDYKYHIGVLGDIDNKEIKWYQNNYYPGGNSYYKENNDQIFPENNFSYRKMSTLDTIVKKYNFPKPDLIKMDVQGCEIDIIKGGLETIKHAKHLIIELQSVDYNRDAPKAVSSIPFIESLGFRLITPLFCNNGPDGDYHFERL